jgi:hypothetical protein
MQTTQMLMHHTQARVHYIRSHLTQWAFGCSKVAVLWPVCHQDIYQHWSAASLQESRLQPWLQTHFVVQAQGLYHALSEGGAFDLAPHNPMWQQHGGIVSGVSEYITLAATSCCDLVQRRITESWQLS